MNYKTEDGKEKDESGTSSWARNFKSAQKLQGHVKKDPESARRDSQIWEMLSFEMTWTEAGPLNKKEIWTDTDINKWRKEARNK